jgi:site-specific DNA recombinase
VSVEGCVGGWLERAVWEEIEGTLRRPERVLARLRQKLAAERRASAGQRTKLAGIKRALEEKEEERNRVLGLYRKGRIAEEAVERQMQEMAEEEAALRGAMAELHRQLQGVAAEAAQMDMAAGALQRLATRLQAGPLDRDIRRELIENLVERVRVDTRQTGEQRQALIMVTYRFAAGPKDRALGAPKANETAVAAFTPSLEIRIKNRGPVRHAAALASLPATA